MSQSNGDGQFDVDWVVVGSGFGGSVSALRLAEKGYSVLVLERGEHFDDGTMPKSSFDLRRYFYAPRLGLRGLFKLTVFRDVFVASGAGVGGGSLVYAMTLYVPPKAFFEDPQWKDLGDWRTELAPHYETAQRMLGVTDVEEDDKADQWLKEYGEETGVADTYRKTRVGTYLDTPGQTVADPYFGGEGPARKGCVREGRCMLGCQHGSKNSTTKNYLWFAQKQGARIEARREVVDLRPLGGGKGELGWEVTHERTGAWLRKDRTVIRARGVVSAGGALGTNELLAQAKLNGSLPDVSSRLGELVRTNSEAVTAVTVPPGEAQNLIRRVAITSSIYPDPHTHIETVTYGKGGGSMRWLFTVLVGDGSRLTRPLKWLGQIARHPKWFLELLLRPGWSERTVIVLVMQTLDNAISLRAKLGRNGRVKLQTEQDPEKPNPTFIPVANHFTEWLARRTKGVPGSSIFEATMNVPTTAHFIGGATIGADPSSGVVDRDQRVFGYENLLVCDGSAIPANVGVNPSLTITALSEHAMSAVPAKDGREVVPFGSVPIAAKTASGEPAPMPEATPAAATMA
ncbi:putative cholesterol oxidase CHOD (cholesterol-O2 oxidoreductase) [Patulibacter medicamentivorans]|jgi:cholesterol oxidase|uniref:Cholesterol oxidase n=1 Tax=Patulibacter medicamentivorans TaxID=1097667 RepID=H0E0S0_9ACTN|nr:GMC family oxidoreductase [Patulibacter medicamentivorans]EHN12684.1 putative cholesterol oxidase CHOD (cholesterol-O2 oxidoreductase) [Patulibacter medicamentivorans]